MVQAKLYIDRHYASNIDLGNISDEAFFSRFHFIRLFKKMYGRTPHQYLVFVRMEKAMQLLKEGRPVSEVCYAVGLESLGSFSTLFKRTTGITPSAFQAAQQQIQAQMAQAPFHFIPACFIYQYSLDENSNFEETA
jgi:AraC-like DNA-binding protein